jgi:hypothetical protein
MLSNQLRRLAYKVSKAPQRNRKVSTTSKECRTMDQKGPSGKGPEFHAAEAIAMPPIMFLVGWAGTNFYEWATAADGIGWRGPAVFGFGFGFLALLGIMDNAVPRSARELKVITLSLLIYGSLIVWFFTLTSKQGPSPWKAVFFTAVVVVVSYCYYRRMVRMHSNKFDVDPPLQQPRGSWASVEHSQFSIWVVEGEVQHDLRPSQCTRDSASLAVRDLDASAVVLRSVGRVGQ